MSGPGIISVDPFEQPCAFCGKISEVRPYGPNDEEICFECEMKDEKTTIKKFKQHVLGDKI